MKLFTIACISALSLANHADTRAREKELRSQGARFSAWTADVGIGFKSITEYERRKGIWVENDNFINEKNARARASGNPNAAIFKHNKMSAMT